MTSAPLAGPYAGSVSALRVLVSRAGAMCLVELQKLRRDRTELMTRAIQPALWLLVFGETFSRIRAIPTGGVRYLDFLAPGILAQSALFVSIFYGIQIIWDRDAGVLAKLMVTPTPRAALVAGKAFAAGGTGADPGARGAAADGDVGRMRRAVGTLVPTGVDPIGRQLDLVGHRHVRGRQGRRPAQPN